MRHVRKIVAAWLTLWLASAPLPALAGTYADEMGRCLVKATSVADRTALVRWLFAAGATHPEVVSIVSVSGSQREELNRSIARLLERLLTESCRAQTQDAIKYEGRGAFEAAFQVLGQVAGRELFAHPTVANSMGEVDRFLDKKKLEGLVGK
jgi:hypothetical protein